MNKVSICFCAGLFLLLVATPVWSGQQESFDVSLNPVRHSLLEDPTTASIDELVDPRLHLLDHKQNDRFFDSRTRNKGASILLAQAESDEQVTIMHPKVAAAESDDSDAAEQAKIAKALANPLSYLWMAFIQHDMIWYDGDLTDDLNEDSKLMHTTMIQPVLSLQLTETWKTIIRPVITINSFDTVKGVDISTDSTSGINSVDFDRKTGLGDTVLWTAFSNQYTPPFVWGFGPTVMLPTASDESLGSGKWSAGPMALALGITEKWIIGGVLQHWWSFAGDDHMRVNTSLGRVTVDRSDVNLTDFQYILRVSTSLQTSTVNNVIFLAEERNRYAS